MGEFFRGWRRKMGVVTLLMALTFMGGWVRSSMICDSIMFPAVLHKTDSLVSITIDTLGSARSSIAWERAHEESSEVGANEEKIDLGSPYPKVETSSSGLPDWDNSELKLRWGWRWCGFCFGESPHEDGAWLTLLVMPYWSITVPLTLISLWLLLSKPRKSTPKKIVEPIPETVK